MGDDGGLGLLTGALTGLVRLGQGVVNLGSRAIPQVQRVAGQTYRFAKSNPAVTNLLKQYKNLNPVVREGLINPLTRSGPTTVKGSLGAFGLNFGRDVLINTAAQEFLPKPAQDALYGAQMVENLIQLGRLKIPGVDSRLLVGLSLGLEPMKAGETPKGAENVQRAAAVTEAAAKEERTQAALGAPTPQPSAGNRVDTSTRQSIGPRPQQAAPMQAPARQIPLTAYEAAVTTGVAPTTVPLSEFYRAQEHLGKYMEESGELQRRLKDIGGARGMSDQALMDWAQKNPALAYREMFKLEKRARDLAAAEQAGS
jgi:hypothetical protein